jgi:hypothetical protein
MTNALRAWSVSRFAGLPLAASIRLQTAGPYIFLISSLSIYYLLNTSALLLHLDLGWHLAAGDLIRERGSVPFQDPWSFTLGDKQWFNLSWLWDVIASALVQYAGFGGLTLFVVACGAILVGYLTSICLSTGVSVAAACISVFAACLLYPSFLTAPNSYLAASPNICTMLFSVIFYGECLRRTRRFLLPLIMLLWANLHGGFMIGFLILGVFGGVALLRKDWPDFKVYFITAAGCAAAILITPLGLHIYVGVTATLGHFVQAYITEWLPYFVNVSIGGSIPAIIYMLAFAGLELRYGRRSAVPLEARLLSWLFLGLGLYQFRYMSFFFLFAAVPLALDVDQLLRKRLDDLQTRKSLLAAGVVGMCTLPVILMLVRPAFEFPEVLSEQDALYLRTHLAHARLLNHWNLGGFLIFRTRGTVQIFVDGRAATAYPDELLRDYFSLATMEIDEKAWDAVLAKYRIDAVLWVKAHEQLRRFLLSRGWKEEYDGESESLYVKP